jgi:hypothetical protein
MIRIREIVVATIAGMMMMLGITTTMTITAVYGQELGGGLTMAQYENVNATEIEPY